MEKTRFGLLTYEPRYGYFNIGDYIQSLAAKQFLPKVDRFVSREKLDQYSSDPTFVILNGWFMQEPKNWPPSSNIIPFFVAFHINKSVAEHMLTAESVAYLKKHEPIGCRDYYTQNLLRERGVDAYFSGCLTLTLKKEDYALTDPANEILICDVFADLDYSLKGNFFGRAIKFPKYLWGKLKKKIYTRMLIPKGIREIAGHERNYVQDKGYSVQEKFNMASKRLRQLASAKLVITSRIHIALPCLAFGTPVVFVNRGFDESRFDGILDFFQVIDGTSARKLREAKNGIEWSNILNKNKHLPYRQHLIEAVSSKVKSITA